MKYPYYSLKGDSMMRRIQNNHSTGGEAKTASENDRVEHGMTLVKLARELGTLVGRLLAKQEEVTPNRAKQPGLDKGR